jgi:hypothetical protein
MRDAWIPVIGAAAVATVALTGAVYLRSRQAGEIGARWNQFAAIIVSATVAIAADRFGKLEWNYAIALGIVAFGAMRLPAYLRHAKTENGKKNSNEYSN